MSIKKNNLEKKVKIEGYEEITKEQFYNLKQDQGIRLFDYHNNCKQIFYKKREYKEFVKTSLNM